MDMERSLEASTPSHSFVDIQSLDVASLREWLEDNGIPQEYSEKFEGKVTNIRCVPYRFSIQSYRLRSSYPYIHTVIV